MGNFTKKCHAAKKQSWFGLVIPLFAIAATTALSATSAFAQVLYNNLVTASTDSRNNAPAYLNIGDVSPFQFVVQSTRVNESGQTVNTLVTQMMSDDLKLAGNNISDVIVNSLAVSITNSNVGIDMVVRPHIRIYNDDHPTPIPPYPEPDPGIPQSDDSPGTLLKQVNLGDFFVPGATDDPVGPPFRPIAGSAILNVTSEQFGALNLPMTDTKYWFGIFFDIDIPEGADQATVDTLTERLRKLGQGLYGPPTVGSSADVHHETDVFGAPYQQNYFTDSFAANDPNGTYVKTFGMTDPNGQPVLSNFGWLVNGFVAIPEPSSVAFSLLGISAFALIRRRKK